MICDNVKDQISTIRVLEIIRNGYSLEFEDVISIPSEPISQRNYRSSLNLKQQRTSGWGNNCRSCYNSIPSDKIFWNPMTRTDFHYVCLPLRLLNYPCIVPKSSSHTSTFPGGVWFLSRPPHTWGLAYVANGSKPLPPAHRRFRIPIDQYLTTSALAYQEFCVHKTAKHVWADGHYENWLHAYLSLSRHCIKPVVLLYLKDHSLTHSKSTSSLALTSWWP